MAFQNRRWYAVNVNAYSQPADYRFSHDSVELAQRVTAFLRTEFKEDAKPVRILDVCAGSGVVGLEIARFANRNLLVDFNEVQAIYEPHFEKNLSWIQGLVPGLEARWRLGNYESLLAPTEGMNYDVVVANPPYFDRGQGNLPPSEFKARARFFLDSSFEVMCRVFTHVLRPGGHAFFLVRDLADHRLDRTKILEREFSSAGEWRAVEPVRGTGLIHFTKSDGA